MGHVHAAIVRVSSCLVWSVLQLLAFSPRRRLTSVTPSVGVVAHACPNTSFSCSIVVHERSCRFSPLHGLFCHLAVCHCWLHVHHARHRYRHQCCRRLPAVIGLGWSLPCLANHHVHTPQYHQCPQVGSHNCSGHWVTACHMPCHAPRQCLATVRQVLGQSGSGHARPSAVYWGSPVTNCHQRVAWSPVVTGARGVWPPRLSRSSTIWVNGLAFRPSLTHWSPAGCLILAAWHTNCCLNPVWALGYSISPVVFGPTVNGPSHHMNLGCLLLSSGARPGVTLGQVGLLSCQRRQMPHACCRLGWPPGWVQSSVIGFGQWVGPSNNCQWVPLSFRLMSVINVRHQLGWGQPVWVLVGPPTLTIGLACWVQCPPAHVQCRCSPLSRCSLATGSLGVSSTLLFGIIGSSVTSPTIVINCRHITPGLVHCPSPLGCPVARFSPRQLATVCRRHEPCLLLLAPLLAHACGGLAWPVVN